LVWFGNTMERKMKEKKNEAKEDSLYEKFVIDVINVKRKKNSYVI